MMPTPALIDAARSLIDAWDCMAEDSTIWDHHCDALVENLRAAVEGAPPQTSGGDTRHLTSAEQGVMNRALLRSSRLIAEGGAAGERAIQYDEPAETPLRKRIGDLMMDGSLPEWAAEQLDQLAQEQEAASHREGAEARVSGSDSALARRALNEWFGEGKWPPVHKLDALIASAAYEARREGAEAMREACGARLDKMQTGANAYTNLYAYMAREIRALPIPGK